MASPSAVPRMQPVISDGMSARVDAATRPNVVPLQSSGMKRLILLLAGVACAQELSEKEREEERRRQKQQEERAAQQLDLARQSAARVEGTVTNAGAAPPDRVLVSLVCGAQTVEKRLTDTKGAFSFSFSPTAGGDASVGRPQIGGNGCFVQAALTGFTSEPIRIENAFAGSGPLRVRLSLRPVESAGLTYSATTMAASPQARKAYEKGRQLLDKRKFAEAEPELRRAVELHPRFAIAWYALGRVYASTGRAAEARHALEQSVAADAKYFNPYPMLVQLDLQERRWEDLAQRTQTAIQLNPFFSADIYLLSAQANLQLRRMDVAEKHAREAVSMDTPRKWPVALRLLGAILAAQGKKAEAAAQYRAFLSAVPDVADSVALRAEIEKLERP